MSFEPEVVSAVGICTLRQVDALYAAPKYFGEGVAQEAFVATGITVSYAVLHQPPMNASVGCEQVVLIAGFMQPKDTWAHFVDSLLPKWNQKQRGVGLDILVMDNRGFGGTDAPFGMYSTRSMAEDILALMDHIGWRSAHIVGGSMGGMLAQELALLDLRRVRSLTLVSTSRDRYKASGRSLGLMVRKTFSLTVPEKANNMVDTLFPQEYVASTRIAETDEPVRKAIARMYELQLKRWPEPGLSGVMGQTAAVQTHFVSDERLQNMNDAGFPILIEIALAAPERVQSLSLVVTSRGSFTPEASAYPAILTTLVSSDPTKVTNAMLSFLYPEPFLSSKNEDNGTMHDVVFKYHKEVAATLGAPSASGALGQTAALVLHSVSDKKLLQIRDHGFPILVIGAKLDQCINVSHSIHFSEVLASDHTKFVLYEDAGHACFLQHIDEIAGNLLEVVQSVNPPAAAS
ncbi:hypothetical protein KRP22_009762 [Phytophthora ramorum]|nr:putative 2-succinyl-6-hydroxy-2,4-cyclohexadiene-1-carboxylate synthase [Phytophthora ramorum]